VSRLLHLALVALAIAALVYVEWHTDEVTVVLALLLALAAALGAARPAGALAAGIPLGLAILLSHLASAARLLPPPAYQATAPGPVDWAVMAALILPALAAAFAGAWVRGRAAG
jgi:hypothetical protein